MKAAAWLWLLAQYPAQCFCLKDESLLFQYTCFIKHQKELTVHKGTRYKGQVHVQVDIESS